MAEAIVSFIAGSLGELLLQQAYILVSVKGQVKDLQKELLWIQSFLEDADSRKDESSLVRNWVSEIRDAAYEIEDIVDNYILKVADEDVLDHPRRSRRFLVCLKKYVCFCQKGANIYSIGKEVEEIKSRIRQTGQAMQNYGIKDFGSQGGDRMKPFSQNIFQQLRRSSPYDDAIDKDIVGLDKKAEEFVVELLKEEDGCRCISITGMGGIGKTTLAMKIYNCEKVKRHFECRAWANVSKEFNVKGIFKRLIKEAKPNLSTEELQEMEVLDDNTSLPDKLRDILKDRTYLVVLDDIWDVEAWESLNRAFPQHSKKGRVILTSRNVKVARESVVHQLRTLNEPGSWKLFVVKAFGNDDCPTNLKALGEEMVKKCDGLPLAITVLAGLLRGKSPQEWFTVGDRFHQQLMKGQGKNNLEKILSLSYDDLPYQLKACYLYIGLFPEDHEIEVDTLVQLWVAEGFIRCERDETMEDVARDYWNELINRSMLTVVEQNDLGEVQSCRIHDLLRDICISKGQEENFLDYYPCAPSSSSSTTGIVCKSRRYAIHSSGINRFDFSNLPNSHLRTLLLFNPNRKSTLQQQQLESISNIRLLKVLDLSEVDFEGNRLPDAFGKLIHLRYLGLSNARAKLPSSIEGLRSLQTLNLLWSDCRWDDIAKGTLSKLTQLRQLFVGEEYWYDLEGEVGLPRIDSLNNLHTLAEMDALVWKQNETTNLINLRNLGIINIGASDVESVLSSIGKLDKIKLLQLELSKVGSPKYAFPMLVHLSHCHHLQRLWLKGKIERLPEDPYREFPPRLTELSLEYSSLGPKAIEILEKLPNLIVLLLEDESIMGKKIVCSAQGFPQLRVFCIDGLETEEWEIKEGALPKLNRLTIRSCNNLKKIPMGLRFVTTLQVLELYDLPQEFRDRFDEGVDAHEIGHITSVKTDWLRRRIDSDMEDEDASEEEDEDASEEEDDASKEDKDASEEEDDASKEDKDASEEEDEDASEEEDEDASEEEEDASEEEDEDASEEEDEDASEAEEDASEEEEEDASEEEDADEVMSENSSK